MDSVDGYRKVELRKCPAVARICDLGQRDNVLFGGHVAVRRNSSQMHWP